MANPFKKITKTANDTQRKWDRKNHSDAEAKKCKKCGAARPKDTNLNICNYCGFIFMDLDQEIKTDI